MIPIVLTGCIIPNTIKTAHRDWRSRRKEYLDAINCYKKYSKIYFLENSHYDLSQDSDFVVDEKTQYLKFEASKESEKGKGYNEFRMLDEFVKQNLNEDCFIKVTGRYIYENFKELFSFIIKNKYKYDLIIDAFVRNKKAWTSFFYVKKKTYLQHFLNSYLDMDDSKDVWAEHVIYSLLKNIHSYTFFPKNPILNAISGSTNLKITTSDYSIKLRIRNSQRILLPVLNSKRLLL